MLYVFYNDIDKNKCAKLVLSELNDSEIEIVPAGNSKLSPLSRHFV